MNEKLQKDSCDTPPCGGGSGGVLGGWVEIKTSYKPQDIHAKHTMDVVNPLVVNNLDSYMKIDPVVVKTINNIKREVDGLFLVVVIWIIILGFKGINK